MAGKCYGIGQRTMKVLMGDYKDVYLMKGNEKSGGGNGALMRSVPIGLYYQGEYEKIREYGILSSYVTHNNLISGWSCVIYSALISLIIQGIKKAELLSSVLDLYKGNIPFDLRGILEKDYVFMSEYVGNVSGYSLDTLNIALWSFITSRSYEETIKKVILLGNDTDTFAVVAGGLAGAYYGVDNINDEWINSIINKEKFLKIAKEISKTNR